MSDGIYSKTQGYLNRRSIRLKDYNYSNIGAYFVTICIRERENIFGEIVNSKIILNKCGEIANTCWINIPDHFPQTILDEYVIMPNHVHGIIVIDNIDAVGAVGARSPRPRWSHCPLAVTFNPEERHGRCNPGRGNPAPTLGKIIAYFKYQSTKHINQILDKGIQKIWQRNYYEHIIRNDEELNRIRKYIIDNPYKWDEDEYNLCRDEHL